MKQVIKMLVFFLFLMGAFTSSQEKSCISDMKCASASVVVEQVKEAEADNAAIADSDQQLMPISQFILVQ